MKKQILRLINIHFQQFNEGTKNYTYSDNMNNGQEEVLSEMTQEQDFCTKCLNFCTENLCCS